MPFLEDGTPVDIVLNPPRRARPHERRPGSRDPPRVGRAEPAGRSRRHQGEGCSSGCRDRRPRGDARHNVATPVFDGAREEEITGLLGPRRCPTATASR
jgi:DNA-directed RNA polymerase subunit beta